MTMTGTRQDRRHHDSHEPVERDLELHRSQYARRELWSSAAVVAAYDRASGYWMAIAPKTSSRAARRAGRAAARMPQTIAITRTTAIVKIGTLSWLNH